LFSILIKYGQVEITDEHQVFEPVPIEIANEVLRALRADLTHAELRFGGSGQADGKRSNEKDGTRNSQFALTSFRLI
jgi:hypothetical protein